MKIRFLIITLVAIVFGSTWLAGCYAHKRTEPEARAIAQFEFEKDCKISYDVTTLRAKIYGTNEFNGPKLLVGKGEEPNETSYQYIWTHKTDNYEIVETIPEYGNVSGGGGQITFPEHKKSTQ
jgi:outer membrane murein-binding lipoprotein Lpp